MSNLPTVWTNVLAGWFLVGGEFEVALGWMLLGISLLYIAGMTLNDAFDVKWDRINAFERPIPSGQISAKATWILGAAQMISGILILIFLTKSHPVWIAGLVFAILLYNTLHKHWAGSVIIMGICRSLVYLAAGSAVISATGGELGLGFKLLAGTMLLYIAGITLVAKYERSGERGPIWIGQFLIFTPLVALLQLQKGMHLTGPILLGLWIAWIIYCITVIRQSIPKGVAVLIAGICLIDACALASVNTTAAYVAAGLLPVTLFFQRFIPAT